MSHKVKFAQNEMKNVPVSNLVSLAELLLCNFSINLRFNGKNERRFDVGTKEVELLEKSSDCRPLNA